MVYTSITFIFFCFKQYTSYVMRISYCGSDVCSSDLLDAARNIDSAAEPADLEAGGILAGIEPVADDRTVDDQAEIGPGARNRADRDVAVGRADAHRRRFAKRADGGRALLVVVDAVVVLVLVVLVGVLGC